MHPASAVGVFSSPTLRTRILRILSTNTLATAKWSATRVVVVVVGLAVFALGLTRVRLVARAMPQQAEVVVQPLHRRAAGRSRPAGRGSRAES